jgi:CheY-like chemotaxis protein
VTTIAVVEDNADNRLLLQAILDGLYRVVEYENGADALAGLAASPPDLVLLDISLPGMDGNEILARIRADAALRTLPVIALTAHAMTGDREKYLSAGFNDYVTKPIVDETILLGAIERWLGDVRHGPGDPLDLPRSGRVS